jgi:two-component system, NtrC family, response regulator GlrR
VTARAQTPILSCVSHSEPPVEETVLQPAALAPVFRTQPRVEWTDGAGRHVRELSGKILVGSASNVGLVVQDPAVSRLHAELDPREDGLWVRDLGSRNGILLEGLQITGARVPQGGKLQLGSTEFVVDYKAAQTRPVEIWPSETFGRLVGGSVPMRELFATLSRVVSMDSSVLVQGETGTGKELIARAIHDASPRAQRPFIVVDCAALPENLLDAELFGHTKGAFTGAIGARIGAIESADGGTVFLDEIGELPITMQPKLLRVLESRTVRRVGDSTHRTVDVRFISATHRDLLTMVNAGEFREDLYFRLAVLPITVPPLRDRKDDIERLVNAFWSASGGAGKVSADLMRELRTRPWRGNVRELRNFIERARALGATEALALTSGGNMKSARASEPSSQSIPAAVAVGPKVSTDDPQIFEHTYKDFREAWVDAGEREYIRRLLVRHSRNVASAAREAGVDRTYIYRLIRKHEL